MNWFKDENAIAYLTQALVARIQKLKEEDAGLASMFLGFTWFWLFGFCDFLRFSSDFLKFSSVLKCSSVFLFFVVFGLFGLSETSKNYDSCAIFLLDRFCLTNVDTFTRRCSKKPAVKDKLMNF